MKPMDPAPKADRERILLLECRLEQARAALAEARADADRVRGRLADAAAREAEHSRRQGILHEELAEARAEIAALHERLNRSEALRAELEGHLFETDDSGETGELVRLRRELVAERQRTVVHEQTLSRLRGRVEELLSSRETLLTRVAEWQQLVRRDGPEAADLAEFMAELRRDILDLEHRNLVGARREAQLRDRLARAGLDPEVGSQGPDSGEPAGVLDASAFPESLASPEEPTSTEEPTSPEGSAPTDEPAAPPELTSSEETAFPDAPAFPEEPDSEEQLDALAPVPAVARSSPMAGTMSGAVPRGNPTPPHGPTDFLITALAAADGPTLQAELLLRLGRTGDRTALEEVRPWLEASQPAVRGAAYEALGRLLEGDASRLEAHLRSGLADPDARVRRRVVLAAATARRLVLRPLLDSVRGDPDPQVRRLVREVLRHAPSPEPDARPDEVRSARARAASGTIA